MLGQSLDPTSQNSLGVYDLPPQHVNFINTVSKQSSMNTAIDRYLGGALQGLSAQDMDKSDDDLKAAEMAAEIAKRTAELDDNQASQMMGMLEQEMKGAPTIPDMMPTRPNALGGLGAALGMALAPGAGGSIMQGYQGGVDRMQQMEMQSRQSKYGAETDAYNKRLGIAKFRAEKAGLTADKSQAQLATANIGVTTAKTKKAERDAKAAIQNQKNELAKNKDLIKMGPEGRYQWALANGYDEEAARFAAYLPSEALQVSKTEGQQIKNEHDRKWLDKNAQQQYDMNVTRAKIMGLDEFAKKFRNDHLPDELLWKFHLMQIGATNQLGMIQDRDFQNRVAQNKQAYDKAKLIFDFADKEVTRLEKEREDTLKSPPTEWAANPQLYGQWVKRSSGMIAEAKRVRDDALRSVPDPLAPPDMSGGSQGLGNTPPNWNPGAPSGLPGVINPGTGQEAGIIPQSGRVPGVLYESTTGLSFKDDNGKDVTEAAYAKMTKAEQNRAKQRSMGINPNPTFHVPYQAGGGKPGKGQPTKTPQKAGDKLKQSGFKIGG